MSSPTEKLNVLSPRPPEPGLGRSILLWEVLFLICLGLGYPTLNRYDPRQSLPDSASYCRLVTEWPSTVEGYFRFRVLEPYMVRPDGKFTAYASAPLPLMMPFTTTTVQPA